MVVASLAPTVARQDLGEHRGQIQEKFGRACAAWQVRAWLIHARGTNCMCISAGHRQSLAPLKRRRRNPEHWDEDARIIQYRRVFAATSYN
jgi:hypothetical protein